MKKPTPVQMTYAIDWLRYNDGDGEEASSCAAVAEWLEEILKDDHIRAQARLAGIPVKAVRARLATLA